MIAVLLDVDSTSDPMRPTTHEKNVNPPPPPSYSSIIEQGYNRTTSSQQQMMNPSSHTMESPNES